MRLDDIDAIIAKAKPWPWEVKISIEYGETISTLIDATDDCIAVEIGGDKDDNLRFIAAARDLMPKLVRVARAAKELDHLLELTIGTRDDIKEALAELEK